MKLIIDFAVLISVLTLIAVIIRKLKNQKDCNPLEVYPYEPKRILTSPEQVLFHRLLKALPEHIILTQVQYSGFLKVKDGFQHNKFHPKIRQKSIDFLVCNTDFTAIAAIELDEKSHDTEKRKLSDDFKNKAILESGLKLHRWRVEKIPSIEEIKRIIMEKEFPITKTSI